MDIESQQIEEEKPQLNYFDQNKKDIEEMEQQILALEQKQKNI